MFDSFFELVAKTLSVFYDLVPNYAIAIAMLTLLVMVITTPFTLKGTRSMIQMQRLQPEMRRLQLKYKDDRQKLNEELMAFYKENQLNPLGGCLPMLLQAPVFIILYNVVRGLTNRPEGSEFFEPKYLDHASKLFTDLRGSEEMMAFGVDLAESASAALGESFIHGMPHVLMVAVVAVSSYYQQKQIQGRNPDAEIPPQQKMLMRLMPLMFVVFAFISPAALVVYFVTSNLYRIAMQHYITRTLYHGEESLGAQARKAAAEAKALNAEHGSPDVFPKIGRKAREAREATATDDTAATTKTAKAASSKTATSSKATDAAQTGPKGPPPPTSRTGGANRSKKKKKRR